MLQSSVLARHLRLFATLFILGSAAAMPVRAQSATVAPPQIVTVGIGEATIIPDRAAITFAVETRSSTAAAAGSENARLQAAVIAAIRAKGVAAEHVTTAGYSVSPNERYDNGQRRLVGYIARNAVLVDVQKVADVGMLIDAALGAGANSVGGLRYYSTRMEAVRSTALEVAVSNAKSDAEIMARAAGGSLGGPLEISQLTDGVVARASRMDEVMLTGAAQGAPTPVVVGEQRLTVRVSTRWLFLPGK